jgi:hypothetical protein
MAYLTGDPHSPDPEDHIKLDWKPVVFTKNDRANSTTHRWRGSTDVDRHRRAGRRRRDDR